MEKVISIVGSEIFTNGSGSGLSGAQMVRPMVISEMPENATISPALADWIGLRPRPVNSYSATIFAFCLRDESW